MLLDCYFQTEVLFIIDSNNNNNNKYTLFDA